MFTVNNNGAQVDPDLSEPSMNLNFGTEALDVLNCMTIITRSMHNCKVFSYYGGVQKVTALLKGTLICVVYLSRFFLFHFYYLMNRILDGRFSGTKRHLTGLLLFWLIDLPKMVLTSSSC